MAFDGLSFSRLAPLLAVVFGLAGCATPPPATDAAATADFKATNDPYEPANRFFYKVDDTLDTYVFRPVAIAYRDAVPGAVRRPIHNMLANASSPIRFANDVFQTKPRRAGDTMMRFLINSTAGVGGMFDVASELGYPSHGNDFGITMALWGVGEGPFLFLPVIGPSDARDSTGYAADIALDPFTYASFGGSKALQYSRYGMGLVDARERLLDPVDQVKKTALDPYATFRSLYRQNRESEVEKTRDDNRATGLPGSAAEPYSIGIRTNMLTRRDFVACTMAAGLWLAMGPRGWAQAASGSDATAFVVKLGNQLVQIIDGPGTYAEKKQKLQPLVEASVDVDGIARFCLGRFWRTATPAQQTAFLALFHDVLMNNIFGKIGEFQGVTFKPTTTVQRDQDVLVGTSIKRPNQEANNVQWDVTTTGGQMKVVDVVAEGTSLRLTQRADYAAYLQRNGDNVDALIAAMKQQVAR